MIALILAGGHGTRLRPLSTTDKPKQFLNLIGEKTLFEQTLDRVRFLGLENIFVATNEEFLHYIEEQAPEISPNHVIAEPAMRNTLTSIANAAMRIKERLSTGNHDEQGNNHSTTDHTHDNDPVIAIIYADHLVRNTEEFQRKLLAAERVAEEENTINIVEVAAEGPNINYGYAKIGKVLREVQVDSPQQSSYKNTTDNSIGESVYELIGFKEKPDLETAKKYLEDGHYLWNTGLYVFKISKILKEIATHAPETYTHLSKTCDKEQAKKEYTDCQSISIDFAVIEKLNPREVRILKAEDLGWSDIGNFDTLFAELEKSGEHDKIAEFKKIIAKNTNPR